MVEQERERHPLIAFQRSVRAYLAGRYHRVQQGELYYDASGNPVEQDEMVRHLAPRDQFGNKLPTNRAEARAALKQNKRPNKLAASRTSKQRSDAERANQQNWTDHRRRRLLPVTGEVISPATVKDALNIVKKKIWTPGSKKEVA